VRTLLRRNSLLTGKNTVTEGLSEDSVLSRNSDLAAFILGFFLAAMRLRSLLGKTPFPLAAAHVLLYARPPFVDFLNRPGIQPFVPISRTEQKTDKTNNLLFLLEQQARSNQDQHRHGRKG
jgi:hypothetical protein